MDFVHKFRIEETGSIKKPEILKTTNFRQFSLPKSKITAQYLVHSRKTFVGVDILRGRLADICLLFIYLLFTLYSIYDYSLINQEFFHSHSHEIYNNCIKLLNCTIKISNNNNRHESDFDIQK